MAIIRQMIQADIEAVQRIAKTSWYDTYEGIIPFDIQNRFIQAAYNEQTLKRKLANSHIIIAEYAGTVVGFAQFSYPNHAKKSLLNAIYIDPHFQGEGIGTKLLQSGINGLKSVQSISLYVEKTNKTAIQFYCAKNFDIIDENEFHFFTHTLKTFRMELKI